MSRPMGDDAVKVMGLYRLCQEFHSLPEVGGIYDQDAVLMHLFTIITSLQDERNAQRKE